MPTTPRVNGQTFAQASQGITDRAQLGALAQQFQAAASGSSTNVPSGTTNNATNNQTSNNTPVYGATGPSVSAYQQQLNQQNAGQAGYVPLKVDGIYGPLTRAASQFSSSNINQPIGSAFNFSSSNFIPNLPTYKDPEKSVDQGKIRSDIISQFQDRIDSLNNVYNSQLTEARNQAKDLTGSTTAILAARGLTGSMRGQSIAQDAVSTGNKAIASIDAERNNAIQSIYQNATELSFQEAQRRREAITSGAKNYVEYLKTQTEVKQANLALVAQQFISQGVDPSTLAPQELQSIAKQLGVTTQDILATYQQEKYKAEKDGTIKLSEGQAQYDSEGNLIAKNQKTYKATGGGTGAPSVAKQKVAIQNTLKTGISPSGEKLGNGRGIDGYVDPYVYITAFQNWGGTTKEFLAAFPIKQNVNPASYNLLPASIRPTSSGRSI